MLSLVSTLISIQKHTRARVGLNRTWLTDLAEELPQLVWAADSHGVKTFCSRKYLGYTGAEAVSAMNSSWQSFIHPDDRIEAARQWFRSLATGEPYGAEYRLRRQDGTYRHFTAAALPIRNKSGKILSWLGISKDVHEEKLAEQNRHRAAGLSSVRRLASSMAHEINNPLEGLTNALYLARHGNDLDQGAREEYLKLAEQELERVNHVTSHSLRFHRQVGTPVLADLTNILEASVAAFSSRLLTGAIEVDRRYQSQVKLLCFDQDIRQVFDQPFDTECPGCHARRWEAVHAHQERQRLERRKR
jgi:PAS domain S-box-containing protein